MQPARKTRILDQWGKPIAVVDRHSAMRRGPGLAARFDAAQTATGNENHWANTDNLDPKSSASYQVRKTLRARSRYEIIENNPYLKGTILMVCNDFVGSGPKLQITDDAIRKTDQRDIESAFDQWFVETRMRQKLWRMRMAKIVDGEAFMIPYYDKDLEGPVKLNYQVVETDRITGPDNFDPNSTLNELDGVRFDDNDVPRQYYVRKYHPGAMFAFNNPNDGKWISAKYVIHWFRQDRGWLRGIPELTSALPGCAILRRYTIAMLRNAETAASLTAVIETEGPADTRMWLDEGGNLIEDDMFTTFPIEQGMIATMPWGYKLNQIEAVPFGVQYEAFVGANLRELLRPLGVTYNLVIGSSKDSNMASAVVDTTIYSKSQNAERLDAEEVPLPKIFRHWWNEARLIPGYIPSRSRQNRRILILPQRTFRWDEVVPLHTDPAKIANYLKTMWDSGFMTDQDIQERFFNRPVEVWAEEIMDQQKIRDKIGPISVEQKQAKQASEDKAKLDKQMAKQAAKAPAGKKTPPKNKAKAVGRGRLTARKRRPSLASSRR